LAHAIVKLEELEWNHIHIERIWSRLGDYKSEFFKNIDLLGTL